MAARSNGTASAPVKAGGNARVREFFWATLGRLVLLYFAPLLLLAVFFHVQYRRLLREGHRAHLEVVAEHQAKTFDLFLRERLTNLGNVADNREFRLVDLKMPGIDGGQVLRTLKEEHRFLEAIILTGHGSLESAVELTKLGAFGYLPKPYELENLIQVLKDAYQARLQKKFAADHAMQERIMTMATGESALGILRRLRELDDERR
jgi:ActR/RegA family two-component response regulator